MFLWDILSGCNASDNVPNHQIEGAETLWQMICASMREYWFKAIGIIQYHYHGNIIKPYDGCTLDQPKPFFGDGTRDVDKFWNNSHNLDLKRMLVELNSEKTSLFQMYCVHKGEGAPNFVLKRLHIGKLLKLNSYC